MLFMVLLLVLIVAIMAVATSKPKTTVSTSKRRAVATSPSTSADTSADPWKAPKDLPTDDDPQQGQTAGTSGQNWKKEPKAPITLRRAMNPEELKLYWRLRLAAPSLSIFPQVALSQILECENFARRSAFKQKVVDFLVCDRQSQPLAVIELDGWRHDYGAQKARDEVKDAALSEAGIRVLRWKHKAIPEDAELQKLLSGLVNS